MYYDLGNNADQVRVVLGVSGISQIPIIIAFQIWQWILNVHELFSSIQQERRAQHISTKDEEVDLIFQKRMSWTDL